MVTSHALRHLHNTYNLGNLVVHYMLNVHCVIKTASKFAHFFGQFFK